MSPEKGEASLLSNALTAGAIGFACFCLRSTQNRAITITMATVITV